MDAQHTLTIDYDTLYNVQSNFIENAVVKELYKKTGIPLDVYLRDCRTIQFGGPRQSGKTCYAFKLLKKNKDTCVIVVNNELSQIHIKKFNLTEEEISRVFTVVDIKKMMLLDDLPKIGKTIVLDDAFYIFDRMSFRSFYNFLAEFKNPDLTIVKIG